MSIDFDRGYRGQPSLKPNLEEQRGIDQRLREESHTTIPFPVWPAPTNDGPGGAGMLVMLLLLVVVPVVVRVLAWIPTLAFLAVGAFLASFLSGLILVAAVPLLIGQRLPYRAARRASFAGLLRYLVVTAILTFCAVLVSAFDTTEFVRSAERLSNKYGLWQEAIAIVGRFSIADDWSVLAALRTETWPTIVGGLILTRAPGLMWFTHALRRRLHPTFEGRRGLFAAGLLAVVAVEVALSAGLWAGNALASRSQVTLFTGDDRPSMLIVYGLVVMVPCSLVAALAAAPVLRAMRPHAAHAFAWGFGHTYLVALRAMLAFSGLSILAVIFFRDADPLVWRLAQWVFDGPEIPTFDATVVQRAMLALVAFVLPGVLWAASIIANDDSTTYHGAAGYGKACVAAMLVTIVVGVPLWALALSAMPTVRTW